ncbi:hypothetical protein BH10BAC2_BH10BAC2_16600 [soil metagenome]
MDFLWLATQTSCRQMSEIINAGEHLHKEFQNAEMCYATGDDSSKIVGATKIKLYKNSHKIAVHKHGIFIL